MFLFTKSPADYYDSIGPWSQVVDTHENHKNDSYHNHGVYDSLDATIWSNNVYIQYWRDGHVHNIQKIIVHFLPL